MRDRVGRIVGGRYRLDERLGEGGMGAVYAATQVGLNRRCAVKLLHETLSQDAELVARFKREAEVAASLGHPNIVQVTDFGFEDGLVFLVMDLLDGVSLADAIAQGPLDPERVRFIASQVLSALEAAHRRGIVHRDLKPDNIFLTSLSGVRDVVKLLDFGIARMSAPSEKMTTTGHVLGTPAYMSPEQARGKKVDPRSDLYSLGVVMYEALSGRMPVSGSNYHELMFNIVDQTPAPLSTLAPDAPPKLIALIDKAMAKDLSDRYQSAAEMRRDLEALGPIQASGLRAAPTTPPGEPPVPTTSADAFAATMTPEAVAAIGTSDPSDSSPAPGRRATSTAAAIVAMAVLGSAGYALWGRSESTPTATRTTAASGQETPGAPEEGARPVEPERQALRASGSESRRGDAEGGHEAPAQPVGAPVAAATNAANDSDMSAMSAMSRMSRMSAMSAVSAGDQRPAALRAYRSEPHPPLPHRAGDKRWQDWSGTPIVWARCGRNGSLKEVYPVLRRTRLRRSGSRNPRVVDRDAMRAAVDRWMGPIAECYRANHASIDRGQRFSVSVDAGGRVTGVRMRQFCPVPRAVQRCVEGALRGEEVTPGDGAPGEFDFDVDVLGS